MRALVTGGSAGLGQALCHALLADGFEVVSVDRDAPNVESDILHVSCDLADRQSVDQLVDYFNNGAPFDIAIFNAGISATGKFEEIDGDSHARVIAVNAEAPIILASALVQSKKISTGGNIAFVSSLSHFTGYPGAASYAASKDAIAVYANSIRRAFKKRLKIMVTAAFPGPLKTDHAERHSPEGADASKRMTPAEAAALILADIRKRKAQSLPGAGAKAFSILGRVAPKSITWAMRKIIYEKLEKTVAD